MTIRNLQQNDLNKVKELLANSAPYVLPYSTYVYWILENYYSTSCFIAEEENQIIGFVSAMPSIEKKATFIWQVCVDSRYQGKGIGAKLLEKVVDVSIKSAMEKIHFSISPGNHASHSLFGKLAKTLDKQMEKVGVYDDGQYMEGLYQIDILNGSLLTFL